jgi:hypothetical protein
VKIMKKAPAYSAQHKKAEAYDEKNNSLIL